MQVSGDGLEADKETGEQEDRDGGNWAHKCGHLEGKGRGPGHHRGDQDRLRTGAAPGFPTDLFHSSCQPCFLPSQRSPPASLPTCRELEAAPISSPKDWATKAVAVARAEKSRKRLVSAGWPVIQYTMLQYTTGHSTWGVSQGWAAGYEPGA